MFRAIMWVVAIVFAGVTVMALQQVGYIGIIIGQFANWGTAQVLGDLVIACTLLMGWIWRDARATGRSPWPYFVATVFAGSFGPLAYLLLTPRKQANAAPVLAR
ncbi:MAG: DUF2834 domain-containing protein [Burkholderiaceae bacterium]